MAIQIISADFDKDLYNSKAHHPLQSWEWGEARRKMGIEVVKIGEYENDELKNVFQFTIHSLPVSSYKIGYLPRSVNPSENVIKFLYEFGKKHQLIFIKLEPYEKINSKLETLNSRLVKSKHPLFPQWTQILDLTKSEDDLLKSFKPKTRYNIRLAQKKGVVIKEESNEKGFEIFSQLYFATTKRQKYFGHNAEYHKIVWEGLKNSIAHILIAYYNDEPLATYELFLFHDILYYPYGGTSDKYRNLMAANLIMWEAIRFGKNHGAKKFDLWGSLPSQYEQSHPWAGFTRFKEGYSPEFVEMIGSYDLVINQPLYTLYSFIYKLREKYLSR